MVSTAGGELSDAGSSEIVPSAVARLRLVGACAGLTALALKQAPNRLVGDTKLDLAVDPARFLARSLHLWDPSAGFGLTGNQSYGYLFPMGPFFLLGRLVRLPPWVVQRLWWALLLCVAFVGIVRLAERLKIGSPAGRMIAGLAFALSPRMISTLGPISVESLPYCLAPWVLAPLVVGAREGSPRRAAARSGVAVFCMGAVNAAAVLAALPPAALYLLTRRGGPRRRALLGWWAVAVLLATAWWVLPLMLLGRYSPPFLDYIESATTTTSVTSLVEVLRGTSDWVAYVGGSRGPVWPAGYAMLSMPLVVMYTMVVVAGGVAGLLHSELRERLWLTSCVLVALAALTFGHVGAVSGVLAHQQRLLLDGVLAPFRNVHKFDVVLRLPLVLGLAHVVAVAQQRFERRSAELGGLRGSTLRRLSAGAALAAVLGAALPALSVGLAPRSTFVEIPGYWSEAATWLRLHGQGRTLLLPGSSFPDYLWGSTNDEPLEPLARSEWAVRNAAPLTPPGTVRFLDAVEAQLSTGQPSAGLAASLADAGVGQVLVRNDLDYGAAGSARPLLVHDALVGSPGIARAATFGGLIGGGGLGRYVDQGVDVPYPAIEVYDVRPPPVRASLQSLDDLLIVDGGPEDVLRLREQGAVRSQTVVLVADATRLPSSAFTRSVLTDGLRRREVFFGRLADNASPTLGAHPVYQLAAPAHDYLPPAAGQHETVSAFVGAADVTASSSRSDPNAFGGARPDRLPFAAVDGDVATAWESDPGQRLAAASWQLRFASPRSLTGLRIRLGDATGSARVTSLRVTGDHGSVITVVPRSGQEIQPRMPEGLSSRLVISTGTTVGSGLGSLSIADVTLPGLRVARTLVTDVGSGQPTLSLSVAQTARKACYPFLGTWLCNESVARSGEDLDGLDRTVRLRQPGSYVLAAMTVVPRPGPALNAALAAGGQPFLSASSSAVIDPHGSPAAAADGDLGTTWRAAEGDHDPTLSLRWLFPQSLSSLTLTVAPGAAASRPTRVQLVSPHGTRDVALDDRGRAEFAPLRTDQVDVHLLNPRIAVSVDPFTQRADILPVGVTELTFAGATQARPTQALSLPCGRGPDVVVGSTVLHTRLQASRAQVQALDPLPVSVCASTAVPFGTSTRVTVAATALLRPDSLVLRPAGSVALPDAEPVRPILKTPLWGSTARTVLLPSRATESVLQVPQNVNDGWRATLQGRPLEPVTVEGWQQGWLVPAGTAGLVHLDFVPDRAYRSWLLVGAMLVLVLLALAGGPSHGSAAGTEPAAAGYLLLLVLGLLLPLIGGWLALLAALALVVLHSLSGWRDRLQIGLAVGCLLAAGLLLARRPWPMPDYAGHGSPAQALCIVAVACVWAGALPSGTRPLRRRIRGRSSNR